MCLLALRCLSIKYEATAGEGERHVGTKIRHEEIAIFVLYNGETICLPAPLKRNN